ncbi:MAG: serine hydrolase, partial [Thermoanaerobaculia bacterium]
MLRRFALLLVLLRPSMASAADIDTKAVDRIMTKTLAAFHIPGAAVAIVQNDRVVYAKGYGVTELGGTTPVGADTIFGIGSTTKAFTTAAMA